MEQPQSEQKVELSNEMKENLEKTHGVYPFTSVCQWKDYVTPTWA